MGTCTKLAFNNNFKKIQTGGPCCDYHYNTIDAAKTQWLPD